MKPVTRRRFAASIAALALTRGIASAQQQGTPTAAPKPNILFIFADNLGYGELGAYGGGVLRGAATPRIDQLAAEGTRLLNFNVESQCTPSRSAFMTGRFAIRSGTHSVPFGDVPEGLTQWEVTIGEVCADAGYATGYYGKWHLGSHDGRLPNDQGFDEWFGIPRTTDEALWPSAAGWTAEIAAPEQMMEGRKGEKSRRLGIYDIAQRRLIDAEITKRTIGFMERNVQARKPFLAYVSLTQPHLPTLPNPAFAGKTGNGDWADMLAEMDYNVGQMLDAVDRLSIRDNTLVVFTSDNGPEYVRPWDGVAGPWRGTYFTHLEASLRVPFMARWPSRIPAGRVSNEIFHQVDLLPTFSKLVGGTVPTDRAIDGVDQTPFLLGQSEKSNRVGFPVFVSDRMQAVKWRKLEAALLQAGQHVRSAGKATRSVHLQPPY